jgi:hypothetical protein
MDEHCGHKDLHGSGRRSITPDVHRRELLYCSSLGLPVCVQVSLCGVEPPLSPPSALSFYSLRPGSYIETRGPTGGPEVVETLYNI